MALMVKGIAAFQGDIPKTTPAALRSTTALPPGTLEGKVQPSSLSQTAAAVKFCQEPYTQRIEMILPSRM